MRKSGAILLLFLFLPGVMAGCEQSSQGKSEAVTQDAAAKTAPAAPPCRLVMGWDPWQPYQYRDAQGDVTGLDVEIARAVAAAADCELELTEASWMELLGRLKAGEVHLLAGATRTSGREAFAVFTAPYRAETFVLYTRADNEGLRRADNLDALLSGNAVIGIVAEYYYGPEISSVLDAIDEGGRLREASIAEMNYERLDMREIDAFLEDPFVASSILRNRPDSGVVQTGIRIQADEVSFMLSKAGVGENDIAKFSDALEVIRNDGTLEEILRVWREMR